MADIKVGQLWGVRWPDEVFIDPTVRGKEVGYRIIDVDYCGFEAIDVKSQRTHLFDNPDEMPSHWKLIEDVP